MWREAGGSHKWQHYFPVYERVLSPLVGQPVRVLEIGVAGGGSLVTWRKFFGDRSTIVGIDIDPACAANDSPASSIHVRIGSQIDAMFLREVVRDFGPFDAIIDDGSHVISHMVTSFGALFDSGLKPDGVYIVEDTHATYWRSHRDLPHTFAEFAAGLMDLQHAAYWAAPHSTFFEDDAGNRLASTSVPRLATLIGAIEAHDSIVVIHRADGAPQLPVSLRN